MNYGVFEDLLELFFVCLYTVTMGMLQSERLELWEGFAVGIVHVEGIKWFAQIYTIMGINGHN